MSHLLAPLNRLLAQLRFSGKFTLVGILFVLPLALVLFYFQAEINTSIQFASLERAGVAYERPATRLLKDVLLRQRLVSRLRAARDTSRAAVARQEDQIGQDIAALDAVDGQYGASLNSTDALVKIKAQWQAVKGTGDIQANQALVDALVAFIQTIGNNSNLILDPDVDSYYVMDTALTQSPQVLVGISRADGIVVGTAQHSALTPDEHTQLTILTGQISTPLAALQGDLKQAEQFNPQVKKQMDPMQLAASLQTNSFLSAVQSGLLQSSTPRVTTQALGAASESAADGLASYQEQALDTLDGLLQVRQHGFLVRRGVVDVCVVLSLLLALAFFAALSRSTTQALAEVSAHMASLNEICVTNLGIALQALERGDLTACVETGTTPMTLSSRDELGEVAATFNAVLAQTQATIGSFRLSQASLSELVRHLQMTAGLVGTASQSLNSTAGAASAASAEITQSVQEIAVASRQAAQGADEVAKGSIVQAASVSRGADLLASLSLTVQNISGVAECAAVAVAEATKAAQMGTATVGKSLTGMTSLHRTVQETAQVISELGQSSAHIGTIVSTIEEIADQTNLLALNAAIEAARVGEAGRGFAVVANEVRKLAERSRAATAEIKGLVDEVQTRTSSAVTAMDGGVSEVEAGSLLAEQAGEVLADIENSVSAVREFMAGILAGTQEITTASEEVSQEITEVAAVVEEASAAAAEMSASAGEVAASIQTVVSVSTRQKASVTQLGVASQELSDVAQDLKNTAARFCVATVSAEKARAKAIHLLKAA